MGFSKAVLCVKSEQYRSLRHTHTHKKKTKNKQLNLPPKRIKKSIKNKTQSQQNKGNNKC